MQRLILETLALRLQLHNLQVAPRNVVLQRADPLLQRMVLRLELRFQLIPLIAQPLVLTLHHSTLRLGACTRLRKRTLLRLGLRRTTHALAELQLQLGHMRFECALVLRGRA